MTDTDKDCIRSEIEGMKSDHSQMISEHLWCKDHRYPSSAWKMIADRTRARYERLEKLLI